MDIHEYQGKEILSSYGVKVQRGYVANNPQEAVAVAKKPTTSRGVS
jgi:succinyl-CoA synthetase beta subunit